MKRRILPLILAGVLLLCTLPQAGSAADAEPLTPTRTYQGQFTDVQPSSWYYKNVAALYELGLTNGKGDENRFIPSAEVSVGEVLTMAARLRSLYEYGDSEKGPAAHTGSSDHWYTPYTAYLQSMNCIGQEFDELYEQPATRAQVAHVLANTLPESLFTPVNDMAVTVGYASRRYIRDVDEYTPYQQDILTLYRWGILSGMDEAGSFLPKNTIQRCQVAAMITRLVYADLRIILGWETSASYSKEGTPLESLVSSSGLFHTAPSPHDSKAIDDNLRYMLSRGERHMSLNYGKNSLTSAMAEQLLEAFLDGVRSYAEQGYNEVRCSYSTRTGAMSLTFSSSLYDEEQIDYYRQATMEAAILIHDRLWKEGRITSSLSEYEKAQVYFTWLCGHCRYDYHSSIDSLSHSGYSALELGLAVCDGYTAAYNLLLKLEGIDCSTASSADHLWTVATLDGTSYHIDPTWGDKATSVDYQYFAMSAEKAFSRFP